MRKSTNYTKNSRSNIKFQEFSRSFPGLQNCRSFPVFQVRGNPVEFFNVTKCSRHQSSTLTYATSTLIYSYLKRCDTSHLYHVAHTHIKESIIKVRQAHKQHLFNSLFSRTIWVNWHHSGF